eukprot:535075-Prymnesium_polylepis.1
MGSSLVLRTASARRARQAARERLVLARGLRCRWPMAYGAPCDKTRTLHKSLECSKCLLTPTAASKDQGSGDGDV